MKELECVQKLLVGSLLLAWVLADFVRDVSQLVSWLLAFDVVLALKRKRKLKLQYVHTFIYTAYV